MHCWFVAFCRLNLVWKLYKKIDFLKQLQRTFFFTYRIAKFSFIYYCSILSANIYIYSNIYNDCISETAGDIPQSNSVERKESTGAFWQIFYYMHKKKKKAKMKNIVFTSWLLVCIHLFLNESLHIWRFDYCSYRQF